MQMIRQNHNGINFKGIAKHYPLEGVPQEVNGRLLRKDRLASVSYNSEEEGATFCIRSTIFRHRSSTRRVDFKPTQDYFGGGLTAGYNPPYTPTSTERIEP
jgi:hypothetical protein